MKEAASSGCGRPPPENPPRATFMMPAVGKSGPPVDENLRTSDPVLAPFGIVQPRVEVAFRLILHQSDLWGAGLLACHAKSRVAISFDPSNHNSECAQEARPGLDFAAVHSLGRKVDMFFPCPDPQATRARRGSSRGFGIAVSRRRSPPHVNPKLP